MSVVAIVVLVVVVVENMFLLQLTSWALKMPSQFNSQESFASHSGLTWMQCRHYLFLLIFANAIFSVIIFNKQSVTVLISLQSYYT